MWMVYVLGLTPETLGELTLQEFINMWHAYIWKSRQRENTIAGLVTVWIANTAGKSLKKPLKVENIFKDGRFKSRLTDADREMIAELYGEEVK